MDTNKEEMVKSHCPRMQSTELRQGLKVRASDRVRQKMGNSAAFSREIMRQERPIMRQIVRFF